MKTVEKLSELLAGRWIQHPRHSGYYFSEDGRAASWRTKNPRILSGCSCGIGYRAISVPVDGGYARVYIHRAVCELFNGGYGIGLHCRHLDTDLTNNAAGNLAWGTPLDNAADARAHGKTAAGERNPQAKLSADAVARMREQHALKPSTFRQLGAQFGVSTMTAHRAITGESWK